jgi:hypothetical protein
VAAGSFRFTTIYEDVRLPILIYENPLPGESAAFANPHPGVDEELGNAPRRLWKPRNELFTQLPTQYKLTMSLAVEHSEFRHQEEWLQKIEHAGVRRRAELLYQQWMDYRRCDESCALSCWRRAGNTKLRNYYVRFPASVRSAPPA